MDVISWLEQIRKLDELINSKIAEREQVWSMITSVTIGEQDDMPHAKGGVSDPVGNGVVKLQMLAEDINRLIDKYIDHRQAAVRLLEQLPVEEYGVLHRQYVRYMTVEEIADDMGYSRQQVWRIKGKALKNLKDVTKCNEMLLNVTS